MDDAYRTLYAWVRDTREVLFRYCEAMDLADYLHEAPDMGWNSIRSTHVHVAGCYWFWIASVLGEERPALEPELYPDVTAVRQAFAGVDDLVERFLTRYAGEMDTLITRRANGHEPLVITPRWLISHVITHEFHHKGQITFLGRMRGHIAPDTDLVLPTIP